MSGLLSWGFNVAYPVVVAAKNVNRENISAESYAALMQMVDTYEENVKCFWKSLREWKKWILRNGK